MVYPMMVRRVSGVPDDYEGGVGGVHVQRSEGNRRDIDPKIRVKA